MTSTRVGATLFLFQGGSGHLGQREKLEAREGKGGLGIMTPVLGGVSDGKTGQHDGPTRGQDRRRFDSRLTTVVVVERAAVASLAGFLGVLVSWFSRTNFVQVEPLDQPWSTNLSRGVLFRVPRATARASFRPAQPCSTPSSEWNPTTDGAAQTSARTRCRFLPGLTAPSPARGAPPALLGAA